MYDDPNATIRREINLPSQTGVASALITKIKVFQAARLKKVHSQVVVAGTNAVAGYDIYVGTTSVGAVTHGTNTAGTDADSGTLNASVPAGSVIELRGKATSATLAFAPCLELEVLHDSVKTA